MPNGMIERKHPKLSVGAQCQLLSISRSAFYHAPQGETALNLDLMLLIRCPAADVYIRERGQAIGRQWFALQTMRGNFWRRRSTASGR